MKICIIGPSCVGKTTLAKGLSKSLGFKHIDLDKVFIDVPYLSEYKKFRYFDEKDCNDKIKDILVRNKKDWIIEGVYPVVDVIEKADVILYLRKFFLIPLALQWRRYFTDIGQRQNFGFVNNLILSFDILRQYFGQSIKNMNNPLEFGVKKYTILLSKHTEKVYDINNDISISSLLKKIN
jgi:adenylate kinase family enzyme